MSKGYGQKLSSKYTNRCSYGKDLSFIVFIKFLYGFTSLCTVNIINNCSNVWSCFFLQVLDDEAETFVVKMWRLLVYETEAKKAGLV